MIQNGQSQLLGGCGLLEVKFETNRVGVGVKWKVWEDRKGEKACQTNNVRN